MTKVWTRVARRAAVCALPALLVFYLRRYVTEPEISAATMASRAVSGRMRPR